MLFSQSRRPTARDALSDESTIVRRIEAVVKDKVVGGRLVGTTDGFWKAKLLGGVLEPKGVQELRDMGVAFVEDDDGTWLSHPRKNSTLRCNDVVIFFDFICFLGFVASAWKLVALLQ